MCLCRGRSLRVHPLSSLKRPARKGTRDPPLCLLAARLDTPPDAPPAPQTPGLPSLAAAPCRKGLSTAGKVNFLWECEGYSAWMFESRVCGGKEFVATRMSWARAAAL